ncbi:hypothetical protein HOL21_01130 [Candidatus Woesearchaeota archaeon]|jgi:hypothetical protein|nr:hypothetical protein [Candidatus Woesearchaeota archaeon]MBT5396797.1 hypothetical protein [Candidatus Woesearchaeota archaeon]MBT6367685.1 hypothetical protein [Candidatus Woesearchaeota archaeon]MBT7762914.1 hypothetical protein [Candidatus Woesearchaeota archaeon]
MSDTKSKTKMVVYAILLVILLFGILSIFIHFTGKMFALELVGFVVLLVLSFVGLAGYFTRWGERVLFFVFLLYIINLLLIWYFTDSLYMILVVIALIGFLFSIPKRASSKKPEETFVDKEPHSVIFDAPEPPQKTSVTKKTVSKSKPKTEFSPGKFVASKNGKVYHLPKCEWAKRIAKNSHVWFKKKEDAWEKGYRAHNCIESLSK